MIDINKVVVLGANGTMGAGSAEVFAAGGCDVVLLARSKDKAQEGIETAQGMAKSEQIADRMSAGSYDDDLESSVAEADLIFEALAENIDLKNQFFDRIDRCRRPESLVATVSSGLSIAGMAEGRSDTFRKNFMGIHLFNPPHVIVGTEVIPHGETDSSLIDPIVSMLENRFGRVVTRCEDQPAFAGNRVGFKVLNEVAQLAMEHGIAFMDYLIGPYTGRAMPPLATVDLVGWDVHKAIVDNVYENTKDESHATFEMPATMNKLLDAGHLGNKTPKFGGFFKRIKEDGKAVSLILDPASSEYKHPSEIKVAKLDFVEKMRSLNRVGRYQDSFKEFVSAEGAEADLARKVIFGYVSYGLNRVGSSEVVAEARESRQDHGIRIQLGSAFSPSRRDRS